MYLQIKKSSSSGEAISLNVVCRVDKVCLKYLILQIVIEYECEKVNIIFGRSALHSHARENIYCRAARTSFCEWMHNTHVTMRCVHFFLCDSRVCMLAGTKAISYGMCLSNDMRQCLHYKAYYIGVGRLWKQYENSVYM